MAAKSSKIYSYLRNRESPDCVLCSCLINSELLLGLTGDDRSVTDDNFIHDITRWAQRAGSWRVTTNLNGSQHSDIIRSVEHLMRWNNNVNISSINSRYRILLFVAALHICIAGRGGKSNPDVLDVLVRAIFGPSLSLSLSSFCLVWSGVSGAKSI